jgi:hypothetical protein
MVLDFMVDMVGVIHILLGIMILGALLGDTTLGDHHGDTILMDLHGRLTLGSGTLMGIIISRGVVLMECMDIMEVGVILTAIIGEEGLIQMVGEETQLGTQLK